MAGQYPETCGVNPDSKGWNTFIYKNQFRLHFEPKLKKVKLDVNTLQSNIDQAIRSNQLSSKETSYWNDQLAKYNIWIRKFERTFIKQKMKQQSQYFIFNKQMLEASPDGEEGWYQTKGKSPQWAPKSRQDWDGLCNIYNYVIKSIRKDRQNFSMRWCGKKSRSDCASPCQYTTSSGCHYNVASIKPSYSLQ